MKKRIGVCLAIALVLGVFALAGQGWGLVPTKINFQGVLKDNGGVAQANKTITFQIGASSIITIPTPVISDSQGFVSASLEVAGIDFSNTANQILTISIDGTPFASQALVAVPYARVAAVAESLASGAGNFVNKLGDKMYGTLTLEAGEGPAPNLIVRQGKVGIGLTNPLAELHLHAAGPLMSPYIRLTNNNTGALATDGLLFGIDDAGNAEMKNYESGKNIYILPTGSGMVGVNAAAPTLLGRLTVGENSASLPAIYAGNSGSGSGVKGVSATGAGVFGVSTGFGVVGGGFDATTTATIGVWGYGKEAGVWGTSTGGPGVQGNATGVGKSGVKGVASGALGTGVLGESAAGVGVFGVGNTGAGISGTSNTNAGGWFQSTNSYGIYATGTKNYLGGNVGIGTTNPGSEITIGRDITGVWPAADAKEIVIGSAKTALYLGDDSTNYTVLTCISTGGELTSKKQLKLGAGLYTQLTLKDDGKVGIGTSAPEQKLHVGLGSETEARIFIGAGDTGGRLNLEWDNNDTAAYITSYKNGAYKPLYVRGDPVIIDQGTIQVDNMTEGAGTYVMWNTVNHKLYRYTSSRRYKNSITPLADNYDDVLKLEPKSFVWNSTGQKDIGFIAEEIDEAGLKNLVNYNEQGQPDAVKYDKIPLYLLGVIKNQNKEITALKARLDALESKTK